MFTGGSAGSIVEGGRFQALTSPVLFCLMMPASDNFGFPLTVGGSGFFEDIDEMFALSCICQL